MARRCAEFAQQLVHGTKHRQGIYLQIACTSKVYELVIGMIQTRGTISAGREVISAERRYANLFGNKQAIWL